MKIVVPFVDLKTQYTLHREALEQALLRTSASTAYILGPEVERFERRFASYLGVGEAIGVANGTDALELTGRALGLGPGDEVLIPANTFIATAVAFSTLGAKPVPVDVDSNSFLLDLEDARKRLTLRTRALVPVHLYGRSADMDAVLRFAEENRLTVIEDACQAHGSRWKGKPAGTLGTAGCFSFYPGKNLGAFGDGGLVFTADPQLAYRLRLLRNYGSTKKYYHEIPGRNSRLDSLQAAVLNVKLDFLDEWNANRFQTACLYSERLASQEQILLPGFDRENPNGHVFHLFVIKCQGRDELQAFLQGKGIQTGIHYPVPIHLHPAYSFLGFRRGDFPVAESLSERILSLPMFPEITVEQVDYVVDALKEFYGK